MKNTISQNLSIATNGQNVIGKLIFACALGLWALIALTHCTSPTAPSDAPKIENDSTVIGCYWTTERAPMIFVDSLIVGNKKYILSTKSRYRIFENADDGLYILTDTKTGETKKSYECEAK